MKELPRPELSDDLIKTIDEEVKIITLVSGTLEDGRSYYAYVLIPPSKYQAFKLAEESGHYDLVDYGQIVAHGEGLEPSEDVQKRMEEEYGADYYFEEELEKMKKEYKSFTSAENQNKN